MKPVHLVSTAQEPIAPGPFKPTWDSLSHYKTPEWFRDAKFGIWAHWGPQCEPEAGDWYARQMYSQGSWQNKIHVERYGPPSKVGFKDLIHMWHAEHWDPDKLVALYARAGAQYFMAMANHHDNFDLWDSKYQRWNSVAIGPKKNIVAGWAKAAHRYGLKFGLSVHASHAWSWYEMAQGSDSTGPLAGVPYDGKLTAVDGKGKWWDGLDPQDLYEQRHQPSPGFEKITSLYTRWNWGDGATIPDEAYCQRFYNRTLDLLNKYHPDLVYFDDTALPLWPVSDAGLKIAADYYNANMARHGGKLEGVLFGKILTEKERRCMVWDIERGQSNTIEPLPYQTDTCLGSWHYDRGISDRHEYKTAPTVIHMLADVVSKNGNLLLSVPVRADGTIDDQELAIVKGITVWMDVNKQSIFGTRPWKIFGEGPASDEAKSKEQSTDEGKGVPFSAADVRFTTKGNELYIITLGQPKDAVHVKALGKAAKLLDRSIKHIELLGNPHKIQWIQTDADLAITVPANLAPTPAAVFKATLE